MRIIHSFFVVLVLTFTAAVSTTDAADDIQIKSVIPTKPALRGQMLDVQFEAGNSIVAANPSDLVLAANIVQAEKRFSARVHTISPLPALSTQGGSSETQRFSLLLTLPTGLHAGPAELEISHEQSKARYKFEIADAPSTPSLARTSISLGDKSTQSPTKAEPIVLEIGKENQLFILPLIDPQDNEAAILLTFRQQQIVREVVATISRTGQGEGYWSSRPYRTIVQVPADLSSGSASLQVRIRANGFLSEPANDVVTLVDSSYAAANPEAVAPRIVDSQPSQVGIGQSVTLLVQKRRSLNPRPQDTIVIVSSPVRVLAIMPEVNTAVTSQAGPDFPVYMMVRLNKLPAGSYKLQVFNPALGDMAGLSNAINIDVVDEITPPILIGVRMATDEDLRMLKQLTPFAPKSAGTACATYDPARRHMTLQAKNLDSNRNYVSLVLETESQRYELTWGDYCTDSRGSIVIRLPMDIKPGTVKVTIANRTSNEISRPVSGTFIIER